jgi:hypothetical protein
MIYVEQEFDATSASSQIFWLLKESELTPSNANILDRRCIQICNREQGLLGRLQSRGRH